MILKDIKPDGLYKPTQVADLMRVSCKYLYRLRLSGKLTYTGKTKRYLGRDILAFALEKEPTK